MRVSVKGFGLAMAVAASVAAAGVAQSQTREQRRSRVADDIARGAGQAAEAINAITDAVRGTLYGFGYRGSAEQRALQACGRYAEGYGQVRIAEIYRKNRDSWRVRGTIDARGGGYGNGYGRGTGYGPRYQLRSFTCDYRYDGRIKFKTKRARY